MDSDSDITSDVVDEKAPTIVAEHLVIRDINSGELLLDQYVVDDLRANNKT